MSFFQEMNDERWIQEKLLQIKNEDERAEIRFLIKQFLKPFSEEYQNSFAFIEDNLKNVHKQKEWNAIVMGIMSQEEYDSTNGYFEPLLESDLVEKCIHTDDIFLKLEEGETFPLYHVYFDGAYEKLQEILKRDYFFPVIADTEYGSYTGYARVRESHAYHKKMQEIYQLFHKNGVQWRPIDTAFLKRMLMLELIQLDKPEEGEDILRITIDYGELEDRFLQNRVPVWNIAVQNKMSSSYPIKTPTGEFYLHQIYGEEKKEEADYLVDGPCVIYQIEHSLLPDGDITIRCQERKPVEWQIYSIRKNIPSEYRSISYRKSSKNVPKNAFFTKGEMFRFAESLEIKGITLQNITVTEPMGFRRIEVYDMNDFIQDRIPLSEYAPILYLSFKKIEEIPFWQDTLSYMYTCFRQVYPEYLIICGE